MTSRLLCSALLSLGTVAVFAADVPKDSPFQQAGATPAPSTQAANLDFAGVSTVGKKTMVNLYDNQAKRSFWVESGKTADGVTVVSYDSNHDQVTVRVNGVEKLLPLRAPSAVVSGPVSTPQPLPPANTDATPALAAAPSAPAPATPTTTTSSSLSQARQEEEARMLVSDLLEIGMAQRKAYEEAQRKAASGQNSAQPASPANASAPGAADQAAPAAGQPAPAPAPSGG